MGGFLSFPLQFRLVCCSNSFTQVHTYIPPSQVEKASFLEFAPSYFEHMAKGFLSGQRSCLTKLLGVFTIVIKVT